MKFESNIKSGRPFINYAHRGASAYAPENTLMAFLLGIKMGANGIETDVQKSKDGTLVLFHDDDLERLTGKKGSVVDYTIDELKSFSVSFFMIEDKIPTLEEFLNAIISRPVMLAIELKVKGIEKEVLELLSKYGVLNRTTITSFDYESLLAVRKISDVKTGFLTSQVDDNLIEKMLADGITEICPSADLINEKSVKKWHEKGLSVRAWKVSDEKIMKAVYDSGADGMTVNFPDKLLDYIVSKINT